LRFIQDGCALGVGLFVTATTDGSHAFIAIGFLEYALRTSLPIFRLSGAYLILALATALGVDSTAAAIFQFGLFQST
jgi:hypothetical protein